MMGTDVLIIGAGPTGLVLALWLTKLGVNVRIVDKTAEPGTTSRALAVQARTLELYRQLDLTDAVVRHGHKVPAVNLWVKGEPVARVPFERIASDLTPYPFLHIFPQDQHERLLIARLKALGVSVERRTELVSFTDESERVSARLRGPDGKEETCEASYIAGCDGARSTVRETIGTGFPGGTYRQLFYVADVDAAGRALDGELHADLDEADFLAVFPLAGDGRARLIGTVPTSARTAPIQGPRLPARRCGSHPQPGWRTGDEHWDWRRDQSRLEDSGGTGRPCARQASRQLRGGTDRLCPAAGRDDGPRLQLRHRRGPAGRYHSYPHRARGASCSHGIRGGSRIPLPYRFADHPELPRRSAKRWRCWSCSGRRPASLGPDRWKGQFRTPRSDDLASPCIRLCQRRVRGVVRRLRSAASCV